MSNPTPSYATLKDCNVCVCGYDTEGVSPCKKCDAIHNECFPFLECLTENCTHEHTTLVYERLTTPCVKCGDTTEYDGMPCFECKAPIFGRYLNHYVILQDGVYLKCYYCMIPGGTYEYSYYYYKDKTICFVSEDSLVHCTPTMTYCMSHPHHLSG